MDLTSNEAAEVLLNAEKDLQREIMDEELEHGTLWELLEPEDFDRTSHVSFLLPLSQISVIFFT